MRSKCYLEADHYPVTFLEIFRQYDIKTFKQAMECKEFWDTKNGRTLCLKCHRGKNAYSVNNKNYDDRRNSK